LNDISPIVNYLNGEGAAAEQSLASGSAAEGGEGEASSALPATPAVFAMPSSDSSAAALFQGATLVDHRVSSSTVATSEREVAADPFAEAGMMTPAASPSERLLAPEALAEDSQQDRYDDLLDDLIAEDVDSSRDLTAHERVFSEGVF
jgi:hypothetical protein